MAITASISLSENSYSVANNTSSVTCKVTVHWTYGSNDRNNTTKTLTFNGSKYTTTTNINSSVTTSGSMTLFNKTLTVAHNSDGTKTVSASVRIPTSTSSGTVTASKSLTLTNIPRYATLSLSTRSRTETSITLNWESNATCDHAWYSLNGGSSWVDLGSISTNNGFFSVNGLSPNTTYAITMRVRRKDSQLLTTSTKSVMTFPYPYANSMPNFTIGNTLRIGIYNPLGRSVTVNVIGADGSQISEGTMSGTSLVGFTEEVFVNRFYASIPNSKSGTYKVRVTYSGHVETRTGGTYSVNTSVASPTIAIGSYRDTNTSVTAITGNNQKLLPTRSTIRFDASGISAKRSATVSSVRLRLNNTNYSMTVSGSSATVSNVPLNSSGQNAVITLTDSRGLTYSKTVPLDIVDYSAPRVSATVERDSGFYSETSITPTVNYTSIGSNAVTLNLKARKVGTTTYTIDQDISESGTTQVILDNQYAWEIKLTATDTLGGVGTYNITLARGLPLMYFDTELLSIGINQFPSHNEALEIAGDLNFTLDQQTDSALIQALTDIGWGDLI